MQVSALQEFLVLAIDDRYRVISSSVIDRINEGFMISNHLSLSLSLSLFLSSRVSALLVMPGFTLQNVIYESRRTGGTSGGNFDPVELRMKLNFDRISETLIETLKEISVCMKRF